MSNDRRDDTSLEWMTLPSLGLETETESARSLPRKEEDNADINRSSLLAPYSGRDNGKNRSSEAPPSGLSWWLNTFRQLPPAPVTRLGVQSRPSLMSSVEEQDQKMSEMPRAVSVDQESNKGEGQIVRNDNVDIEHEEEEEAEVYGDWEKRVSEMALYLQELYIQLHQETCFVATDSQESRYQRDNARSVHQHNCREEDRALFDELYDCYFGRQWASRHEQEDGGSKEIEQSWQPQHSQPPFSAAKIEMVYQTLVDLGEMLVGHEPLDITHMEHLRKVIPIMISSCSKKGHTR